MRYEKKITESTSDKNLIGNFMKTNEELQKDVMEELKSDPLLSNIASEIGVTAKEGVVTLSGLVDTYNKKLAAERAAQRVMGVKVVAVDLEVRLKGAGSRSDIEISEAVKNALKWHTALNEDLVEIKVDDGWIYLDGVVEWDYQKKAAELAVQDLVGVRGVTNRITIRSTTVDAKEIKNKVAAAFHRSATIDSSNVKVDVSGNKVTIRGKVRSWAEKREAENVAWGFPGIVSVDNQIEVDTEVFSTF
jgi:osmotically-inducible protein OsmY